MRVSSDSVTNNPGKVLEEVVEAAGRSDDAIVQITDH